MYKSLKHKVPVADISNFDNIHITDISKYHSKYHITDSISQHIRQEVRKILP